MEENQRCKKMGVRKKDLMLVTKKKTNRTEAMKINMTRSRWKMAHFILVKEVKKPLQQAAEEY